MYDAKSSKPVCTLATDLSSISQNVLVKKYPSKGRAYWHLSFELEMRMDSAHIEFLLTVDGEAVALVRAVFNHREEPVEKGRSTVETSHTSDRKALD